MNDNCIDQDIELLKIFARNVYLQYFKIFWLDSNLILLGYDTKSQQPEDTSINPENLTYSSTCFSFFHFVFSFTCYFSHDRHSPSIRCFLFRFLSMWFLFLIELLYPRLMQTREKLLLTLLNFKMTTKFSKQLFLLLLHFSGMCYVNVHWNFLPSVSSV